jgi:hypothetical protein
VDIAGGDLTKEAVLVRCLALRVVTAGHAGILEDTTGLLAGGCLCGSGVVCRVVEVGLLSLSKARRSRGSSVVRAQTGGVALLASLAETVLLAQIEN